jgi:hypothetical protein
MGNTCDKCKDGDLSDSKKNMVSVMRVSMRSSRTKSITTPNRQTMVMSLKLFKNILVAIRENITTTF